MQTTENLMQIEREARDLRAAYLGRLLRDACVAVKRAFTAHATDGQTVNA